MFTLTSSATKVAILALSAGMALSSFGAVAFGFQAQAHTTPVFELPQVVVIGYRASVSPDTLQAAVKVAGPAAI